jgi:polygalacturonase
LPAKAFPMRFSLCYKALAALLVLLVMTIPAWSAGTFKDKVKIYPAPAGETLSTLYTVTAQGKKVPVYTAKVAPADIVQRAKAMDDKLNSASYFAMAAFVAFDMEGNIPVTVSVSSAIHAVKILPASAGILPTIKGSTVSFTISSSVNLTIEINGEVTGSLHLFANPMDDYIPNQKDTNVIYFGPGIHEISRLVVGDNKTVYIAGGAILRTVIKDDEPFRTNAATGLKGYAPSIELKGNHIRLIGRGIIDASACPTHARNMIFVRGQDIQLEGVVLRDASLWTVPVRGCDDVKITNLKLLGYRANSDGIDICNSRNVTVQGCFIRTLDDLVVVKADKGQGDVQHIVVKDCVLWNQFAHALSIGAELRENVSDVRFTNCDIIHDTGREWSLRVYQCDAGIVSDVHFDNIRIEEGKKLISLWIGKAVWSRDEQRGHIKGISFNNISAAGAPLRIELTGYATENQVENIIFEKVFLNGKPLTSEDIKSNEFVKGVTVK